MLAIFRLSSILGWLGAPVGRTVHVNVFEKTQVGDGMGSQHHRVVSRERMSERCTMNHGRSITRVAKTRQIVHRLSWILNLARCGVRHLGSKPLLRQTFFNRFLPCDDTSTSTKQPRSNGWSSTSTLAQTDNPQMKFVNNDVGTPDTYRGQTFVALRFCTAAVNFGRTVTRGFVQTP